MAPARLLEAGSQARRPSRQWSAGQLPALPNRVPGRSPSIPGRRVSAGNLPPVGRAATPALANLASRKSELEKWRKLPHDEPGTWKPPPPEAQLEAIGLECDSGATVRLAEGGELEIKLEELYPEKHRNSVAMHKLQRLLQPLTPLFLPQLPPVPGTWMFDSTESPQTFKDYVSEHPHLPARTQHTIYLMPLTKPGGDSQKVGTLPDVHCLRAFVEAWFGLPCKLLPHEAIHKGRGVAARSNGHSGDMQYHAKDALRQLRIHLPSDGYCILGITMDDLFTCESSCVFSSLSLKDRAGIFSFCRMDPAWYRVSCHLDTETMKMIQEYPPDRQAGDQDTLLRRAHGILSHDIGHLFGMRHCQFFVCRMQGTSGLKESDTKHDKADLCPVCLRKLSWFVACGNHEDAPEDISSWCIERYRRLLDHCEKVGPPLELQCLWLRGRLAHLDRGVLPAAAAAPALAAAAAAAANAADEWEGGAPELVAHTPVSQFTTEKRARKEAELLMVFARHDEDGDGKMKVEEFCQLMEDIDGCFSNFSAMRMFEAADVNRDGVLDVKEFLAWLLTPQGDAGEAETRILARLSAEAQKTRSLGCSGDCFDFD